MNDWHIAYVLSALNPVFLIVNILIMSLEMCSASVAAAGTHDFCMNVLTFLSATARPDLSSTTTTTPLPLIGSTVPCNIVHSVFDLDTNDTVTYTVNMCTTTPLTTTTIAHAAAQRFDQLTAGLLSTLDLWTSCQNCNRYFLHTWSFFSYADNRLIHNDWLIFILHQNVRSVHMSVPFSLQFCWNLVRIGFMDPLVCTLWQKSAESDFQVMWYTMSWLQNRPFSKYLHLTIYPVLRINSELPQWAAEFTICRIVYYAGNFLQETVVSVDEAEQCSVEFCCCAAALNCSRGTSGGRTCASFVAEPADSTEATSTDFSFSSV